MARAMIQVTGCLVCVRVSEKYKHRLGYNQQPFLIMAYAFLTLMNFHYYSTLIVEEQMEVRRSWLKKPAAYGFR